VWKRRKDLLYFGSAHGAELPELFGLVGDNVATDAYGIRTPLLPPPPVIRPLTVTTSQLYQSLRPQPPKRFYSHQPAVKHHLAKIYRR